MAAAMLYCRSVYRAGVNLLRGIPLFDVEDVPTAKSIQDTLNVMGLIGALALALAVTLPAAVDDQELQRADARFSMPGYSQYWRHHVINGDYYLPSEMFGFSCALAVIFLTASVVNVIQLYVMFVFAKDGAGDRQHASHYSANQRMRQWYTWGRFMMMLIVVGLVAGICMFLVAHWQLYHIKFADRRLLQSDGKPTIKSLYYKIEVVTWTTVIGSYGVVFIFGYAANRAALKEEVAQGAMPLIAPTIGSSPRKAVNINQILPTAT